MSASLGLTARRRGLFRALSGGEEITEMRPIVKESEDFTEEEIAARRDEVVRRMLATPPERQPRGTRKGKVGRPIAS
ncbi:MAG: hypothetical protein QOG84_1017 [Sphingomonadales bacterium]|jgi:hypothetical protein|nr:hypothetical protein [Sphingomonadales bacterium]